MAPKMLQCFYLIPIFMIVYVANISAIYVETVPETFNEIITEKLDVSCIYNGSRSHVNVKQIVMIQLMVEGESPLAILRGGKITFGPGMRSDMKAEGNVKEDASYGSLRLSITNPRRQDAGTYECMMFYLNEMFQMEQEKASTNATLEELDLTTVVAHLARTVSGLKKTVEEQEDVISKQKDVIKGHEKQLNEQHEHIQKHNDTKEKGKGSNAAVSDIQQQIKMQNEHLKKQDANDRVTQIVIASLQNKVLNLGKTVTQQSNYIQQLLTADSTRRQFQKQQQKGHTDHIDEHDQNDKETALKIKNLSDAVSELKTKMHGQETRLFNNALLIRQQNTSLGECQRRINLQGKELKDAQKYQKELESNSSFISAFSYGYDSADTFDVKQTMVFREEILNIGDDYNPETGVFTAPRNGLYVFHLTATAASGEWSVEVDLRVNKKTVASLHARDEDHWDQSSISTVVLLKSGDKVKPVVTYKHTGNWVRNEDHYSTFTGYLLKRT